MNGFGVALFETVNCGGRSVVVALLELFAVLGSVVPAGAAMLAVFVMLAPLVGAVPLIVIVTLPPEGNVVIVLVTLLPATLTAPHTAPPVCVPQLAPTAVTPAGTASLKLAPFAALGPTFEMTIV